MGKGEIAHYEQFLLFPQCFQKACFPGVSKGVIVLEWVKVILPFTTQSRLLTTLKEKALETLWEKEKMLVTSIFSFPHSVIYSYLGEKSSFLVMSKILSFGKGLNFWVVGLCVVGCFIGAD